MDPYGWIDQCIQATESQALQILWQVHSVQALIKVMSEGQALQAMWQGRVVQALVKHHAELQALQTAW